MAELIPDLSNFLYLSAGQVLSSFSEDEPMYASLAKDAYMVAGDFVQNEGKGKASLYDGTGILAGIVKFHEFKQRFYDKDVINMVTQGKVIILTPTKYTLNGQKEYQKLYVKPDRTLSTKESDGVLFGCVVENSVPTSTAGVYVTFIKLEVTQ